MAAATLETSGMTMVGSESTWGLNVCIVNGAAIATCMLTRPNQVESCENNVSNDTVAVVIPLNYSMVSKPAVGNR